MVFEGSTSSNAISTTPDIVSDIISFSIANKTGGSADISVGIMQGSSVVYILYNYSLTTKTSYIYTGKPITMLADHRIIVSTTAEIDYYFSVL